MLRPPKTAPDPESARIEVAVGPHGHRDGWSVLRATFARQPDHERRVARALDALIGPPGDPDRQEGDDGQV
jgi:hypothetical protein